MLRGRAVDAADVFSLRRRRALRMYTDYFVPHGVYGFCWRMWINRHGCFWITMSRQGEGARYLPPELDLIDRLTPIVATGEVLHLRRAEDRGPDRRWVRAREMKVTRAEYQAVELVERGFTNEAIASLLGRSIHTVRNQLAAVFRKVHVASRAELLFALSNDDHRVRPAPSRETYLERVLKEVEGRGEANGACTEAGDGLRRRSGAASRRAEPSSWTW